MYFTYTDLKLLISKIVLKFKGQQKVHFKDTYTTCVATKQHILCIGTGTHKLFFSVNS